MSSLTLRTGSAMGYGAARHQPSSPAPITLNRGLGLRIAAVELLIFAGLLGAFILASHLVLIDSAPPVSLSANLAAYLDSGYSIQLCETGWAMGHTGAGAPHCDRLTDWQRLSRSGEVLAEGEYLSVRLNADALGIDQLLARWGTPRLTREAQGVVGLVWDLPTLHATASLIWGEPHSSPQQAILTLKHA